MAQFRVLRIDARKFARMWAALISQALIDKLQIIERYNHRTKRCCVLSQDDGTSSSDRRAIECPKAGNVRKTRHARIDRPATVGIVLAPCRTPAGSSPEAAVPAGSTPAIPAIKHGPKRLGVAQPFWCVRQWKRFLPLRRPHRRGGAETLKNRLLWERCRVLDTRSHDDHWTQCRHPQTPCSSRFFL